MIANEVEKLRETATGKKLESNELKEAEEARIRGGAHSSADHFEK
jgi:hypothetical protein